MLQDGLRITKMAFVRQNRHNWAWIGADEKYEYSQCQYESCDKIGKTTLAGKFTIVNAAEKRAIIALV